MSKFKATGIIHAIGNIIPVGERSKREVILQMGEKYPQFVPFEAFGDKVELTEGLNEGDEVEFVFELRGREYNKPGQGPKWFGSNGIREVEVINAARKKAAPAAPAPTNRTKTRTATPADDCDF